MQPFVAGLNCFKSLFEVCNYVFPIFDSYLEPNKSISYTYLLSYRRRDTCMSYRRRMLNKGIRSPKTYGEGTEIYIVHKSSTSFNSTLYLKRKHTAEFIHLLACKFILKMAWKPRISNPFYFGVRFKKFCNFRCVFGMSFHPNMQGFSPLIQSQASWGPIMLPVYPTIADIRFMKFLFPATIPPRKAACPLIYFVQLLRKICPKLKRPLEIRCSKSVIHNAECPVFPGYPSYFGNITYGKRRIGRALKNKYLLFR